MSDDYIKREDALDCFSCDLGKKDHSVSYQGFMIDAAFRINDIPAADVVERKVGRWLPSTVIFPVKNTDGTYSNFGTLICSSCNYPVALVKWNNYCPCCGADMREASDEEA